MARITWEQCKTWGAKHPKLFRGIETMVIQGMTLQYVKAVARDFGVKESELPQIELVAEQMIERKSSYDEQAWEAKQENSGEIWESEQDWEDLEEEDNQSPEDNSNPGFDMTSGETPLGEQIDGGGELGDL